jgi:hypothetical protein
MNEKGDHMMRACFKLLALSIITIVGAAFSQQMAMAQSAIDVPINQTVSSTCPSGEAVALNGNLHFTYSFTTDQITGISTYQVNIGANTSGTGQTTQSNYSGSASFGYNISSASSPTQFPVQVSYGLASQGSAASLALTQLLNVTVDTSGNVSASLVDGSTRCAN